MKLEGEIELKCFHENDLSKHLTTHAFIMSRLKVESKNEK